MIKKIVALLVVAILVSGCIEITTPIVDPYFEGKLNKENILLFKKSIENLQKIPNE